MIEHRQLRHVLALADHCNFRRAAEAAHITQPALTKSIHGLEEWLGVRLFDRYPRAVVPTAFGKVVIQRARTVVSEFEGIKREIDLIGGLDIGELSVGAEAVFAENLLGPGISRIIECHPGLQLRVKIDNFRQLSAALNAKDIDLCVADIAEIGSHDQFEVIPLNPQRIVHFCRPEHPLLDRPQVSMQDFLSYPVATPNIPAMAMNKCVYKNKVNGSNSKNVKNERNPITIECENYPMLKKIVQTSHCVSSAPMAVIADELQAGALAELTVEEFEFYSQAGVVHLRNHTLSPAAEALIRELASVAQALV